jgi:hypothetical protein
MNLKYTFLFKSFNYNINVLAKFQRKNQHNEFLYSLQIIIKETEVNEPDISCRPDR